MGSWGCCESLRVCGSVCLQPRGSDGVSSNHASALEIDYLAQAGFSQRCATYPFKACALLSSRLFLGGSLAIQGS